MYHRVLIANRGIGAIRAAKTYKRLNVETVGIYTNDDKDSLHLKYVDRFCPIGGYLDIRRIVLIAKATKSDLIDPVYGFRAEHPQFPSICEDYGIIFIGPNSSVLKLIDNKISTSNLVRDAGIPVVPKAVEIPRNEKEAVKIAKDVGFPVVIKPVGGGGGKGTFIAKNEEEVIRLYPSSQRTAKSTTDTPDVYIEKFLEDVRHEELQFISDLYNDVVFLGGRSCCLQRRKQKIIEEIYSKEMEEVLEPIKEKCVEVIKKINYAGALTFEFLVDKELNAYFLEGNKRLQVEHRPTQMVFRVNDKPIDLVEERLRIALGEKLSFKQNDVKKKGWAINCRIYAEDSWRNFQPSTSVINEYSEPQLENIIIDSCIYPTYKVSEKYDPLLATVTAWENDRKEAVTRLNTALNSLKIGSTTNLPLLRMVLEDEDFINGDVNTTFIERKINDYKLRYELRNVFNGMFHGRVDG